MHVIVILKVYSQFLETIDYRLHLSAVRKYKTIQIKSYGHANLIYFVFEF